MDKLKFIFLINLLGVIALTSCRSDMQTISQQTDKNYSKPTSTSIIPSPTVSNKTGDEKKSRENELYEKMVQDNKEMCNGELEAIKDRGNRNLNSDSKEIEINEYKKIIEEGCDTTSSRTFLGLALNSAGRFEESVEQFRLITNRDPKDWAAHWILARVLIIELHQFEEGLKEIHASKNLDDMDDLGYNYDYYIGKAQDGLGNRDDALKHYKIYIKEQTKVNDSDPNLLDAKQRMSAIDDK